MPAPVEKLPQVSENEAQKSVTTEKDTDKPETAMKSVDDASSGSVSKDTDEDVIMLDTDSTDGETDESNDKLKSSQGN